MKVATVAGEPIKRDRWVGIEPEMVSGLVCSHSVYAEPEWYGELFRGVRFYLSRPDLTDVGPPENWDES